MGLSRVALARLHACWAALLAACSPTSSPQSSGPTSASTQPIATSTSPRGTAATSSPAPSVSVPPAPAAPDGGAPARAAIGFEAAARLLFVDEGKGGEARLDPGVGARAACTTGPEDDKIRCLLARRYDADATARAAALDLFESTGSVAGLEREHLMNGGFRGTIRLVPELPIGKHARHLGWIAQAARDQADVLRRLGERAGRPIRFRTHAIAYRFFRSVGRTTPSAYATSWSIGYNVSGSLHGSADAVRETLWHEIFHLNDSGWSRATLGKDFDAIVAKCKTSMPCLAPYAPGTTTVRGGTYYAFQPDNGDAVNEYAAELALRYYKEQRAMMRGESVPRPFKCGPEPNARAYEALADEFFGGVDLVPSCK